MHSVIFFNTLSSVFALKKRKKITFGVILKLLMKVDFFSQPLSKYLALINHNYKAL